MEKRDDGGNCTGERSTERRSVPGVAAMRGKKKELKDAENGGRSKKRNGRNEASGNGRLCAPQMEKEISRRL